MRRFILFIMVAVFFISIAFTITILSIYDIKNTSLYLQPVLPLTFISYWLIFIAFDERRRNAEDEIYIYHNFRSIRGFAFIGKRHVVPFFLLLFGTVSLAITGAFLGANKGTSELAWVMLCISFLYGTIVIIYFQVKLASSPEAEEQEKQINNLGMNIGVFFASVATLGLFYLLWRLFLKQVFIDKDISQ